MKSLLPILRQIEVASPCPARWEDMAGDDRVRYCRGCEKNVYNFSAMSAAEVVDLVRETEGRLCARFYQREDGTVLTADCPVGVHHRVRRRLRFAGVAAAFGSFFLSGCLNDPEGDGAVRGPKGRLLAPAERPAVAGGLKPIQIPAAGQPGQLMLGKVCIPSHPAPAPTADTAAPEQGPEPRVVR